MFHGIVQMYHVRSLDLDNQQHFIIVGLRDLHNDKIGNVPIYFKIIDEWIHL
jgi:hypothetical protein